MANSFHNTEYYLVVNNQQEGPFTIQQLATKSLKPESLVWTAGMENWAAASSIPVLASLFNDPEPIPFPPVQKPTPAAVPTSTETRVASKEPLQKDIISEPKISSGESTTGFIDSMKVTFNDKRFRTGAYVVAGMLVFTGALQIGKVMKKASLKEKNKQTEQRNIQAAQNLQALSQKTAEQEAAAKKEQERREREITESVKRRVAEINLEIKMQEEELVLARQKFSEVTAIKIFRTAAERSEEVNAAMDQINVHEKEIERLKKEIKTVELNGERAIEGRNY